MPQQPPSSGSLTSQFHAGHGAAAAIALALVIMFGLHFLGFRFVVAAGGGR